jgi:imidazolonepropionase-like amidohydrolase
LDRWGDDPSGDGSGDSDGRLVIKDGLIKEIGPHDGRAAPSTAGVLIAKGLHIYPGLINADTTLGLMEIESVAGTMDEQEIGDFQPDLSVLSAYNPFASAIEVARCDGVTSALIAPGVGTIGGRAGSCASMVVHA